jgi:hypothetical protein
MAPHRRRPLGWRPTGATLTESAKNQCKKVKKNPAGAATLLSLELVERSTLTA